MAFQYAERLLLQETQEDWGESIDWAVESGERSLDNLNWRYTLFTSDLGKPQRLDYSRAGAYPVPYLAGQLLANAADSIMIKQHRLGRLYQGEIEAVFQAEEGVLSVTAEDNGAGIDQAVEDYLFKLRILGELRKSKRGVPNLAGELGRGIYQIKLIIDFFKGSYGYKNKGENRGAIFWFRIPLESLAISLVR